MQKEVDHLFRIQYGKMVSTIIRLLGTSEVVTAEDIVQETFQKALSTWRIHGLPENPEAWLMKVARNYALDALRKIKSHHKYISVQAGPVTTTIAEIFSKNEIEDNVLRLLFAICHSSLKTQDQIIFALKTFSGFSRYEISAALLKSEESIKKAISRARKSIVQSDIKFTIPTGKDLEKRIQQVHLVIYLLFNEGFHSSNPKVIIKKDLMAEAMRLCDLLIQKYDQSETRALMAMMCFHSARVDAKYANQSLFNLEDQNRELWIRPLIDKGNYHMSIAVHEAEYTSYHWEAAIAGEYVAASSYQATNWDNLEYFYRQLLLLKPNTGNQLNLCVILAEQDKTIEARKLFDTLSISQLKNKEYLYHAVDAYLEKKEGNIDQSLACYQLAIAAAKNEIEISYLNNQLSKLQNT